MWLTPPKSSQRFASWHFPLFGFTVHRCHCVKQHCNIQQHDILCLKQGLALVFLKPCSLSFPNFIVKIAAPGVGRGPAEMTKRITQVQRLRSVLQCSSHRSVITRRHNLNIVLEKIPASSLSDLNIKICIDDHRVWCFACLSVENVCGSN